MVPYIWQASFPGGFFIEIFTVNFIHQNLSGLIFNFITFLHSIIFMKLRLLLPVFLAACAFSCNQFKPGTTQNDLLDIKGIDSTVRPQDDFFHYVNGAWIKNT